jgi:hypothetical protein
MACIGFGTGFVFMSTSLAAQCSVDLPRMGVATGLVNFTRQLGGALGVAAASSVLLNGLSSRLATAFPGQDIETSSLLVPGQDQPGLSGEAHDLVRSAFAGALHNVFLMTLAVVALGALTVLLMPRGSATELRDRAQGEFIDELERHPEELTEYSLPH